MEGGSGTAGSHWDNAILYEEIMNPNVHEIDDVISYFTLALL